MAKKNGGSSVSIDLGSCGSSKCKPRYNSDKVELFLWIFLLSMVFYTHISDMSLSSFFNLNPSGATESEYLRNILIRNKIFENTQDTLPEKRKELTIQVVIGIGDNNVEEILADSIESSQYIIPVEYQKSSNKFGIAKAENEFPHQLNKTVKNDTLKSLQQSVRIKCTAPFPIEFVYEGSGKPNFGKIIVEKRKVEVMESFFEYFYIATLDFEKNSLEETDTGRYTCQSIGVSNPKQNEALKTLNKDEAFKERRSIDLFVPGDMLLLHLKDNVSGSNGNNDHEIVIDTKEVTFTLPCGISHPATNVSLYRKQENNYILIETEDKSEGPISYDKIIGLQIPVSLVLKDMSEILVCRAHFLNITREVSFQIIIKGPNSHAYPVSSLVILPSEELPIQIFKCEATEPVTVNWINGPSTNVAHGLSEYEIAPTINNKLYSASFIATPTQFLGDSTVAKFECLRKRDGKTIHKWDWIKDEDVTKSELTFNGKSWSCCRPNFSPRIFVENCSSMIECQVRSSLLQQQTSRKPTNNSTDSNGCAVYTIPDDFQAGLIKCVDSREDDLSSDEIKNKRKLQPTTVFFRWKDRIVVIRDGIYSSEPLDEIITMRLTTITASKNQTVGATGEIRKRIECSASSMLFAKGFRWKIYHVDEEVYENVQLESALGHKFGGARIISYQEDYQPQTASYNGVLTIELITSKRPLLSVKRNSNETGIANLELHTEKIAKISCEAPLWYHSSIWISSFVNNSLFV